MKASTLLRFFGRVCLLGVVLCIVKACDVMAPGNINEFSGIVVMLPLGLALLGGLIAALFYAAARAAQKREADSSSRQ